MRNHYAEVRHLDPTAVGGDAHPVDVEVERKLRRSAQRKRIRTLSNRLLNVLGTRSQLWLELEAALSEYHAAREEGFFNVGFERGAVAGRAGVLENIAGKRTPAAREFAAWIRDITVESQLPRHLKVASLLESAWAVFLDVELPPSSTRKTKR